jgi:hypothetical protein
MEVDAHQQQVAQNIYIILSNVLMIALVVILIIWENIVIQVVVVICS